MNKFDLCKEIGGFFGDFFIDSEKLCIDNGEEVFRYDTPDDLLKDWIDTLIMHQHDTFGDPSGNWEKEIVFIYTDVLKKLPAGIRAVDNKYGRTWYSYVDVADGSRHGKNLHLGNYSSIVDAIYARKDFFEKTSHCNRNTVDYMDEILSIAHQIQENATILKESEKTAARESSIRSKYDLSSPEAIFNAVDSAREAAKLDTNQAIYEFGWLNGYARGFETFNRKQGPTISPEFMDPDNPRVVVDLGFANLVAYHGTDSGFKEVYVDLEDKEGNFRQDLAIIGGSYHYDDSGEVVHDKSISIRLWGDEHLSQITHEFEVGARLADKDLKPTISEQIESASSRSFKSASDVSTKGQVHEVEI